MPAESRTRRNLRRLATYMSFASQPSSSLPDEETEDTAGSEARPVDLGLAEGKSLVSVPSSIRVADDSPLVGGLTSVRDETEILMDILRDVTVEAPEESHQALDIVSVKPAVVVKQGATYTFQATSARQWEKYMKSIQRLSESELSESEVRERLNPVEPESSIPEQAEQ